MYLMFCLTFGKWSWNLKCYKSSDLQKFCMLVKLLAFQQIWYLFELQLFEDLLFLVCCDLVMYSAFMCTESRKLSRSLGLWFSPSGYK